MNTRIHFALLVLYSIVLAGVMIVSPQLHAQTWKNLVAGISEEIRSIDFANADVAIAVGEEGLILRSTDAGTTWKKVFAPTTQKLNSVRMQTNGMGYIGGDFGTLLQTTDYGTSWKQIDANISQNEPESFLAGVEMDAQTNTVVVCGRSIKPSGDMMGVIGVSKDQGIHWNTVFVDSSYIITQCRCYANGLLIAVGSGIKRGGIIMRSTDAGSTWSIVKKTDYYLSALDGNGMWFYAVGLLKQILKSTDAGLTWQKQISNDDAVMYQSIYMKNENLGWICGNKGTVITTTNGGETWKSISMTEDKMLIDIVLSPKGEVIVVGGEGTLSAFNAISLSVDRQEENYTQRTPSLRYNTRNHSIESKDLRESNVHLYVFDILGNTVLERRNIQIPQTEIPLPTLAAGVYSAVLITQECTTKERILFLVK